MAVVAEQVSGLVEAVAVERGVAVAVTVASGAAAVSAVVEAVEAVAQHPASSAVVVTAPSRSKALWHLKPFSASTAASC